MDSGGYDGYLPKTYPVIVSRDSFVDLNAAVQESVSEGDVVKLTLKRETSTELFSALGVLINP